MARHRQTRRMVPSPAAKEAAFARAQAKKERAEGGAHVTRFSRMMASATAGSAGGCDIDHDTGAWRPELPDGVTAHVCAECRRVRVEIVPQFFRAASAL